MYSSGRVWALGEVSTPLQEEHRNLESLLHASFHLGLKDGIDRWHLTQCGPVANSTVRDRMGMVV